MTIEELVDSHGVTLAYFGKDLEFTSKRLVLSL